MGARTSNFGWLIGTFHDRYRLRARVAREFGRLVSSRYTTNSRNRRLEQQSLWRSTSWTTASASAKSIGFLDRRSFSVDNLAFERQESLDYRSCWTDSPQMTEHLWQRGCELLAAQLPEQQFNTWIRPLRAAEVVDAGNGPVVASVRVPNRFKLDWIRSQYAGRIESVLSEVAGKLVRLELTLATHEAPLDAGLSAPAAERTAREAHPPNAPSRPSATTSAMTPTVPLSRHRLNAALTFDTLVAGRANQMARTAALHVAGAPGQMYNPLFIYGGVGLGKTHLIHAIGNSLLTDRPAARVLYLHAEQFISDVVRNYQRKTFTN